MSSLTAAVHPQQLVAGGKGLTQKSNQDLTRHPGMETLRAGGKGKKMYLQLSAISWKRMKGRNSYEC